jgi:hypothetical protein
MFDLERNRIQQGYRIARTPGKKSPNNRLLSLSHGGVKTRSLWSYLAKRRSQRQQIENLSICYRSNKNQQRNLRVHVETVQVLIVHSLI